VWRVTVRDEDAQLGPKDAPATVVLFSNFENATSKAFAPNVRRLVKEFGKKVRVVFKHKVIPGSPGAIQASEAALAAGEQGKFWEFHDRLSVSTGSLSQATFEAIGQEVGLNTKRFQKALTSGRFRAQVLQDSLLANGLGAHSMPNILVNGVRTRGEKSYDVMKALVEEQLANRPKGRSYDEIVAAGKGFEQLGPSVGGFDTQGSATLGKAGARVQVVVFEDFQ
jgi:protein-disulfide isomerase